MGPHTTRVKRPEAAKASKEPAPCAPTFSHLLDLPRELRDLIWDHCLLNCHGPPATTASDYRQYDSWGEECNHYPRRTHVNSTALLCCSHQVHAEVASAIARLRAQHRLSCSLRILLRNERHLFLDWTCVPTVATHYDSVDIELKLVGKPEPKGPSSNLIKTLHPSALSTLSSSLPSPSPSILHERKEGDFTLHRHLFKLLARLLNYGPSFAGDPVIFSAISPTSSASVPPPRLRHVRPSPTTLTHLTFNVLTPPPSHTPPHSYRPSLYPWQPLPRPRPRPRHQVPDIPGPLPPLCVALLLREFTVWALHGRQRHSSGGENAFLVRGVRGGVAVLLDGAEVDVGDVGEGGAGGAGGGPPGAWWEPVLRGEGDGCCGVEMGGLHRYCGETRGLRMRAAGVGMGGS